LFGLLSRFLFRSPSVEGRMHCVIDQYSCAV
jgi:hypothetical protein